MKATRALGPILAAVAFGCAESNVSERASMEPVEVKVRLEEVPARARSVIERELAGADLEDIARKQQGSDTVYEADIIKAGQKWELVVGEDGNLISKAAEGGEEDRGERVDTTGAGWRDRFGVSTVELSATGTNTWMPLHPGRVLKLRQGREIGR